MTKIDIGTRIDQYVKLRDLIKSEEDAHKALMKPKKDLLETLGNVILSHITQMGLDNVKGSAGTAYRIEETSASLADPQAFRRHVIGSEAWDLLDWKANKTATKEFVEANGVAPPGVNYTTSFKIGVRRS
jgi:hypothetical protein